MINLIGDLSGWLMVFLVIGLPVAALGVSAIYAMVMEFWNLDEKKVGTSR